MNCLKALELIHIIWSAICRVNEKFAHTPKSPGRKRNDDVILLTTEELISTFAIIFLNIVGIDMKTTLKSHWEKQNRCTDHVPLRASLNSRGLVSISHETVSTRRCDSFTTWRIFCLFKKTLSFLWFAPRACVCTRVWVWIVPTAIQYYIQSIHSICIKNSCLINWKHGLQQFIAIYSQTKPKFTVLLMTLSDS